MADLPVVASDDTWGLAAWEFQPYEGAVQILMDGPRGRAKTTLTLEDCHKVIQALVKARNASWPDEKPIMLITEVSLVPVPGANAAAQPFPIIPWETIKVE